jgi:hypothetical protein
MSKRLSFLRVPVLGCGWRRRCRLAAAVGLAGRKRLLRLPYNRSAFVPYSVDVGLYK